MTLAVPDTLDRAYVPEVEDSGLSVMLVVDVVEVKTKLEVLESTGVSEDVSSGCADELLSLVDGVERLD